jgi:hypothetical protein
LLVEKPMPVQEVALVDDQVSVDDWPAVMDVGLAVSEAVGAVPVTVTVAFALADALPLVQVTV